MVMLMHEHTRSSSTRTQAAAREAVVSRWASCLRQPCAGFFLPRIRMARTSSHVGRGRVFGVFLKVEHEVA